MTDSFFLIKLVELNTNELDNVLNDNITDDNFKLTSFYKPQIIELLSRPLFAELNFSVLGKKTNIANNDQDMMIFMSLKDAENVRDVIWPPGTRNASSYAIKLIKKLSDNTCSDKSITELFKGYSQNTMTYRDYLKYIRYYFTLIVVELNHNIIGKTFLGTNDICYYVNNYDYDIKYIKTFNTREMAESYLKLI